MISFDQDVDVPHSKNQPKFYGYIPDDNGLRGRCFALMTLISALHNLSRSVGCALLAAGDGRLVAVFVVGEILLYLALMVLRGDLMYWVKLEEALAIFVSLFSRVLAKVIVDYTGCVNFRHPYESGGLAFCLSMVWAQVFRSSPCNSSKRAIRPQRTQSR